MTARGLGRIVIWLSLTSTDMNNIKAETSCVPLDPHPSPTSSCSAVVPYVEHAHLPFEKSERQFTFSGHTFIISQKWTEAGVSAVVWNASVFLSEWMEQSGIDWHGKTVLELGAGTGLSGMVASALGAHVTLTDRRLALDLLKLNVKQNRDYLDPSVRVAELNWGQNLDEFAAVSPQWDVIIGADIVYIEDTFDALLATLRQLCGQKTDIYLACKIRYDRDLKFLSLMEDHFQWKKTAYSEQNDVTLVHARLKEIISEEQQECSV